MYKVEPITGQRKKIANICFPKGIKTQYEEFNKIVKPDGINLDYEIDPLWARGRLKNVILQGGLDPKILLTDKETLKKKAIKFRAKESKLQTYTKRSNDMFTYYQLAP